jgi:uncharacterized membrane protein YedE/YeeE
MNNFIFVKGFVNTLSQPWHWSISGAAIAFILFLMLWMGRSFGVSTAFRNFCQMAGAGKKYEFFNFNIKDEYWRIAFIVGAITGGIITALFLPSPEAAAISDATITHLQEDWGFRYPQGHGLLPTDLFNFSNIKGMIIAIVGGFLVGFGARYGDGCTSGHAITGLSHLQLPSFITVIGFFIGGLTMTWFIMPLIFG